MIVKKNLKIISLVIFIIAIFGALFAFTRGGEVGDPLYYQYNEDTKLGGPFELSNTTARYALTKSIVDSGTFFLNEDLAKFSAPDIVDYKGKFISIFTPGVSFIGVPLYALGKFFGLQQSFTFFTNILFAVFNIFLVAKLSSKLGAGKYSSILCGFIFAFATNALGFTLTFTQHQISTSMILLSILNAAQKRTFLNNLIFGALFGMSVLVDIPNAIILAPLAVYVAIKNIDIWAFGEKFKAAIKLSVLGIILGMIPFAGLFAWYNFETTGSYIKIAQNIGRSHFFRTNLPVQNPADSSAPESPHGRPLLSTPFKTRNQLNGFYILLLSDQRSWLYYSPVLLLGILGLVFAFRNPKTVAVAKIALLVVLFNIVLYSMFGDPWGGWSFGARYLIPAAAIMAAAVGVVIQKFRRNPIFITTFFILFSYSVYVSTLGALTTNAVPPEVETKNLKPSVPYTYEYNLRFINKNQSENLLFNFWAYKLVPLWVFWYIFASVIVGCGLLIYLLSLFEKESKYV